MPQKYSVPLSKIIKEMSFETVYLPKPAEDIFIETPDVNRPGLILAGYDTFFDPGRINFLGRSEVEYINSRSPEQRAKRLENFISSNKSFELFEAIPSVPKVTFIPSNSQSLTAAIPLANFKFDTGLFTSVTGLSFNISISESSSHTPCAAVVFKSNK